MPQYNVAHIKEQGQQIIIVLLDDSFGSKSTEDQNAFKNELQIRASSAGLAGIVVPVWERSNRLYFIAPTPWHPFFKSMTMSFAQQNVNRTLSW
jgi:hypothetical protein